MKYHLYALVITLLMIPHIAMAGGSDYKIAVLGDSLTAGYGLPEEDAFPAVMQAALKRDGHDVTVLAASISGETTAGGLNRVGAVIKQQPNVVLLALGANDALRGKSPATAKENLASTIEALQQAGIEVWLAGMKAPRNMGQGYVAQFDGLYGELERDYAVALYPFLLEGVAMKPELNLRDRIHPNANGVRVMVQHMLPFIKNQLSKAAQ